MLPIYFDYSLAAISFAWGGVQVLPFGNSIKAAKLARKPLGRNSEKRCRGQFFVLSGPDALAGAPGKSDHSPRSSQGN
jgi:hypothetical protein